MVFGGIKESIKENIEKEMRNNCVRIKEFDTKKGGIYLEITDDPRGWMLGDKTRRIYEATIAQVTSLTDLLVSVSPSWDRIGRICGIKVSVHNSIGVSRMLVSINDDVGSSVEYAKHDGSRQLELSAEMGQHVCIEPIANGSWIRVKIFPGENVLGGKLCLKNKV